MKKILGILSLFVFVSISQAEDMHFITVLSSPKGTFATLETPDTAVARSQNVYIGTSMASGGHISIDGRKAPSLGKITMDEHTTITSNAVSLQAPRLNMSATGKLTGGALLANVQSLPPTDYHVLLKANAMYSKRMDVKGGRAEELILQDRTYGGDLQDEPGAVSGTSVFEKDQALTARNLVWNNQYGFNGNDRRVSCEDQTELERTYKGQYLLMGEAVSNSIMQVGDQMAAAVCRPGDGPLGH